MSGATRRGFSPLRDLPALLWLVAVLAIALAHPVVPAPRWLMIHLLLLGAVSHSILVWSRHFADALLRTTASDGDLRAQRLRLILLNGGALTVVAGIVTATWPVTAVGATGVATAAGWHACSLVVDLRRGLGSRFATTVRYYVAAAALLPVGALLGVLMARGLGETSHVRVMLAHAAVNVLGWMGLAVLGTLVTLWPTILRTRIADGAVRAARRALPVLLAGIALTAGTALVGPPRLVAAGLVVYLAGVGLLAAPFVDAARRKPPTAFPAWSVLAATSWLVGSLAFLVVATATAPSWMAVHDRLDRIVPGLAAGFGAQVLLGALSYLVPVALGGGPGPARAGNAVLDRGAPLRLVVTNAGLLVCLLPVPATVRVAASALVLLALVSFLPLLVLAIRASHAPPTTPIRVERPRGQAAGLAVTGLAAVVLAVALGVALDPAALGRGAAEPADAGVRPTGATTHVVVTAANMRFTPNTIEVPAGNRLVIEVRNADDGDVHDLVLGSGQDSGRLAPGESAEVVVPVVGRDLDGWCSVLGHRRMGMTLTITVTGSAGDGRHQAAAPAPAPAPAPARDATLPALTPGRVHRETLRVSEVDATVAPDVTQRLWTYGGTAPGPVLHGRVGDRFVITLLNDSTMGHSIDFHAGATSPDRPMRTIAPGRRLVYRFTARRSGIWMYHCSTMPMSAHIANGLFGAVVIDPPDLPRVDRSYVLVQSELFLGSDGGEVDLDKLAAQRPDAVVFNGRTDQYDGDPLRARAGDRLRIWVLDAGPDRPSYFHVVGGQFDTVFSEGAYLLRRGNAERGGSQVLALGPAQGGFVELTLRHPGHYPFVSHLMADAERGAHGVIEVAPR